MFGFIKKLIGGIFGFLGGLFGKKNEFYLELKEEAGETAPAAPVPVAKVEPTPVAKVEPVKATSEKPAKPEPVKAAKAEPAPATETTFAPKYLLSTGSNSRRRPGANMNGFLDMARQVKVPG